MRFEATKLPGVLLIETDVYPDERGFFQERYNQRTYAELPGLDVTFVQDNHSRSARGVLRGLHLQRQNPQGKLVSVITGRVWDVAVDVDPSSATFKEWVGVMLTAENSLQLYIPPGYAHGFCVLSESADFIYKCTDFYRAEDEHGLLWNDAELGIEWPLKDPVLSERDARNASLAAYLDSLSTDSQNQ